MSSHHPNNNIKKTTTPIAFTRASSEASSSVDPLPFPSSMERQHRSHSTGVTSTATPTASFFPSPSPGFLTTTKSDTAAAPMLYTSAAFASASAPHHQSYQSAFKHCLKHVDVPKALQMGIPCVRVYANGKTTNIQYLTLSPDKFTLFVTSQPLYGRPSHKKRNNNNKHHNHHSLLKPNKSGGGMAAWFFRRSNSNTVDNSPLTMDGRAATAYHDNNSQNNHYHTTTPYTTTTGTSTNAHQQQQTHPSPNNSNGNESISSVPTTMVSNTHTTTATNTTTAASIRTEYYRRGVFSPTPTTTTSNTNAAAAAAVNNPARAIDIGAIHRIQRGHANRRFQMLQKHRQDSAKALLLKTAAATTTTTSSSSSNNNNNTTTSGGGGGGAMIPTTSGTTTNNIATSSSSISHSAHYSSTGGTTTDLTIDPGLCFSIIFRGDWTLDLMMMDHDHDDYDNSEDDNQEEEQGGYYTASRDEVLNALDRVIQTYQTAKRQVSNEVLLLRYVWIDADKDKSNTIKANELGILLDRINYQMKKSEWNGLYDNFSRVLGLKSRDRKHGLTFEQTCTLLHKIKRDSWVVKPINQYWSKLFGEVMNNGKPRMTVSDKTFLEKFLHANQGETHATLQDVQILFVRLNQYELPYVAGDHLPKDPHRIDKNRFEAYLLGEDNDVFDPIREGFKPRQMHRQISEYWINSSHNTYLTGDQLTSNSSIDMYSNALYRGCKCLELDVWDGYVSTGDDGPVPVVWHGHTMTSKILFKDIIKAIKLYLNFHPDSFPLILSFENHCTLSYQEVMAEQLVRILGDSLFIPKEESLSGPLPSPWDLRGMVVIKGRRPANLDVDDYDDENSDDGAPSTVPSEFTHTNSTSTASQQQQQQQPQPAENRRVHPALARLTLFHGTKFKGWDESVMNPTHHMHSFSENKLRALARRTNRRKWAIYNQSHMSRSYPAGSRVDSSNYIPVLPWSVGTQMVALNFQTPDAALLLNDGRFRENGGCGYVLKPSRLIDAQGGTDDWKPVKLSIRVLSGSCLPKPNEARTGDCIDPYVKIAVYDVQNGTKETVTSFATNVVPSNGFFPIWNSDKYHFQVENFEAAMLQLSVYDKKSSINATSNDELVASSSIPISCLRKGLRSVRLYDTNNSRSGAFDFASLLVDIKTDRRGVVHGIYGTPEEYAAFENPTTSARDNKKTLLLTAKPRPISKPSSSSPAATTATTTKTTTTTSYRMAEI